MPEGFKDDAASESGSSVTSASSSWDLVVSRGTHWVVCQAILLMESKAWPVSSDRLTFVDQHDEEILKSLMFM